MPGRFDVIVVGAGSGGGVVAARLASCPGRSVLLLEAGPDHRVADTPPGVRGPSFHRALQEPGRQWTDLVARRTELQAPREYLRGRGVGGCSAVNAMIGMRAPDADHDEWGSVFGAVGWSASEARRWYERIAVPLRRPAAAEHGPLARALLAAGGEAAWLTRDAAGRRVGVNDAYLEGARAAGLHVHGDALVDRVLLDADRRACGVRLADGREYEAGTVVVAAGAVHSPALLLRSGIEREGIGVGLQDHPSFPIAVRLRRPYATGHDVLAASALWRGSSLAPLDLQVLVVDQVDLDDSRAAVVMAAAMRVHSRGAVRLRSADPLDHPVTDFAMLTDERDMACQRAAVAAAERILTSPSFRAVAEVLPYDGSDEGLRRGVGDYVHATSTCRMGAADDPQAVVDGDGCVLGYSGLYVCDASVLPRVPRANTHLPVMMVAERTAARLSERLDAS